EATWKTEPDALRIRFVEAFHIGLSQSDEPFLENALDDASADLRNVIKKLLSLLPDSRFCQRMLNRALSHVKMTQIDGKNIIRFTYPQKADASMIRDGITDTYANAIGLLKRVISYVPVRYWCELWNLSPQELLDAVANHQHNQSIFREAFAWSVFRFEDTVFAPLIFDCAYQDLEVKEQELLLQVMPEESLSEKIIDMLDNGKQEFRFNHPAVTLLMHLKDTWSERLSHVFMESLSRYLKQRNFYPDKDTRMMLITFTYRIPGNLKNDYIKTLSIYTRTSATWNEALDEIRFLLDFRAEMLNAIHE
ncbi:MAG TPA: DUF5691 domain-containing protein, partial [Aggregatilineales bacterium]|nr:DUF5691 domain-containing protein [Aggregatilineales bacterium]